jgi:hypothetical protein
VRAGDVVQRFLHRFWVRVGLSIAILASLVPYGDTATSDACFLAIFGLEFVGRVFVFATGAFTRPLAGFAPRQARSRLGALTFLTIDFVALLSFFPWAVGPAQSRWLRLLRLTRMLLLVGYWAPLMRDLWDVMARRERVRQLALMGLIVSLLSFAGAAILEHVAAGGVDFNGDGIVSAADEGFFTRIWWSFRQIQDPGNMLQAPVEAAALAVSLLLTVSGLVLVSFLIGLGADIVRELVEIGRGRPVGFRGHTVVVHTIPELGALLRGLSDYHDRLFRRARLAVVGLSEDPPSVLRQTDLRSVRYRAIASSGEGFVVRSDVARARRVVVLAETDAPHPDALTAGAILAIREVNADAWIVAEVLEQSNASATRVAGGPRTIIVPTEKLLALYAATAVRQPERIPILDELLSTTGGHEVFTYFYDLPGFESERPSYTPNGPLPFATLHSRGLSAVDGARILALGVVHPPPTGDAGFNRAADNVHGRLALGTQLEPSSEPIRGLVAVAPDFDAVRAFASRLLHEDVLKRARSQLRAAPKWHPVASPRALRRVVMLGFRPASVDLCAALMASYPDIEIQLVVNDRKARDRAMATLDEHAIHIVADVWREHGPWGTFAIQPDARVRYRPYATEPETGHLRVDIADWASERTLLGLPDSGDHLGAADLVVLFGGTDGDVEQRTAMTVLKIADLVRAHPTRFQPHFEVLAGIADPRLGHRLAERYRRAAAGNTEGIRVIATETLRAQFTFRSVAAPGFDAVFSELMSPWGTAIDRLVPQPLPTEGPASSWCFVELAEAMAQDDVVLVAVDVRGPNGMQRNYGEDPKGRFLSRDLVSAWCLTQTAPSGVGPDA